MGKNYYGLSIPDMKNWEDRKQQSLNEAAEMKSLIPIIEEYYEERKPSTIHIGKSSAGWDFIFNLNSKKYFDSKTTLQEWLKTLEITDEYSVPYTYEEFWDQVEDRKWNGKPTKTHRSETQFADHYIVIDNIEFIDGEFC